MKPSDEIYGLVWCAYFVHEHVRIQDAGEPVTDEHVAHIAKTAHDVAEKARVAWANYPGIPDGSKKVSL